ncbi:hypothetical protein BBK14_00565 [Parafrankia soli]|uniref:Uncharacterized protein n=1 Tax=Parafrankia soli TaxID=2599596 RepID=A0A1S1RPT4_9ACTN|nr:hypothetical protein BBK14_00565 [Parafrankia soli]CAI7979362.1 hypothetical protein FRAHR75_600015 [Frankia sp. Hr75.2]SQD96294.1 conserved hypothetical protein [Parafrankia sp. Ea1.12]
MGTEATRSPGETQFTFDLEKSPRAVAEYTVRARSEDSEVAGRHADIVVGPASSEPPVNGRAGPSHGRPRAPGEPTSRTAGTPARLGLVPTAVASAAR